MLELAGRAVRVRVRLEREVQAAFGNRLHRFEYIGFMSPRTHAHTHPAVEDKQRLHGKEAVHKDSGGGCDRCWSVRGN